MSTEIAVLFARDPKNMKEADIDKIIAHLRSMRLNFDKNRPVKTVAKAKPKKQSLDLNIEL